MTEKQVFQSSLRNVYLFILWCSLAVQQPNLSHPFHLHGYAFNVIGMGRSPDRNVKKINLKHALDLDRRGLLNRQFNLPPGKDTIAVPNNGYVVFRFRADNPGR
jgi:FtsP/CotA-like multicopper oxidase with cupredoxin domain